MLGGLLTVAALVSAGALSGQPAVAQPVVQGDVELVGGCQIRAFMPYYGPATPLFQIANDIEAGNPRFWFMRTGPAPAPTELFDPRSAERSAIDILTEEAGYVCVDFGTLWHRPPLLPPPCDGDLCPR